MQVAIYAIPARGPLIHLLAPGTENDAAEKAMATVRFGLLFVSVNFGCQNLETGSNVLCCM